MCRRIVPTVSVVMLVLLGCNSTELESWTASPPKSPPKSAPIEIEEITCEGGGVGEDGTAHRLNITFGKRLGITNGGIEIDADGRIVAAIDGNLEILSHAGAVESTIPLGGAVYDFDLDKASGAIAAVGDFGIAVVENGAVRTIEGHSLSVNDEAHVSIGTDQTVAVLDHEGLVEVFGNDGTKVCDFTLGNHLQDVEVVAEEQLIIVCGFTQATRILQIPWMYAYNYEGNREWINYNKKVEGLGADTRCNILEFAPDGLLYMSGEQSGGGSPFDKDPKDFSKSVKNVSYGRYQNPYQLNGSAHIGYLAAYQPSSGDWVKGTRLLGRLSNGKGNYLNFTDHEVAADGSVLVSGKMAYAIANRDCVTVNDQIMPGNGSVVAFFDNTLCRRLWISFGNGGDGDVPSAVGFSGNKAVFMHKDLKNCVLTEANETAGNYIASFSLPIDSAK